MIPRVHRTLAALLLVCGCGGEAREGDGHPRADARDTGADTLPPGEWVVAARHEGVTILAPAVRQRGGSAGEIVLLGGSGPPRRVAQEELPLTLSGVPPERAQPLTIGRAAVEGRSLLFSNPGSGAQLERRRGLMVFEAANALWRLTDAGGVTRLTADTVGPFRFDELAARQREGAVILHWAAAPAPDPAGVAIAFVSNREAVLAGGRGQSVWILDLAAGEERPLLAEPGRWYRAEGWLGGEVVLTGERPGVWAIDPAGGALRQLAATGALAGVAEDGSAIAVALGPPRTTRMLLTTRAGTRPLPAPPEGQHYLPQASFAPGGARLLLVSSDLTGERREGWVVELGTGTVTSLGPLVGMRRWPAWVNDSTILLNVADPPTGSALALLRPLGPSHH